MLMRDWDQLKITELKRHSAFIDVPHENTAGRERERERTWFLKLPKSKASCPGLINCIKKKKIGSNILTLLGNVIIHSAKGYM